MCLQAKCRGDCTSKSSEILCLFQNCPFKQEGLGYAMQWYNNLQICLEHHVNAAILKANSQIQEYTNPNLNSEASIKDEDAIIPDHSISIPFSSINEPSPSRVVMLPGECGHLLQQRCPACFGGNFFGCSLEEDGGDIQVCIDGNFNHQHLWSAGDCPNFYNPVYILSKDYVNDVRAHIETLQKTPKPHQESSHTAGSGSNFKTNMEKFDNANIDTSGEQQKYAIALIEHLFSLLLQAATVMVLYDVACILDHSLHVKVGSSHKGMWGVCFLSFWPVQIQSCYRDHAVFTLLIDMLPQLVKIYVMTLGPDRPHLIKGINLLSQKAHQSLSSCGIEEETKLHQATHVAIKKHAPALMAGIQKYNNLCATLASLYKPKWAIPLPEPLPMRCPSPDARCVWISHPMEEVPHWLTDTSVCEGIHAMLKVD
ncbi:hypothetical protein J132_02937 [Termitomyces sp. J132]|nr:hypothetical protein J132_02937 [Termitomyces sp. J132]